MTRTYNQSYAGANLDRTAFPLGGIGAGMICLEGCGALSHVSLRHRPTVFHEPQMYSAVCIRGEENVARVLQGPVPAWKIMFPWGEGLHSAGNGDHDKLFGLPRMAEAELLPRFPFATVTLRDPKIPLAVEVTGWSPFTPGDADASSLPMAALEYRFTNTTDAAVEAVYSFHAPNFMATGKTPGQRVVAAPGGFVLHQPGGDEHPFDEGSFAAVVDDADVRVNCRWFRAGWFDGPTMVWRSVQRGETPVGEPYDAEDRPSAGGSLYVPLSLQPGESRTIRLLLGWYVPTSDIRNAAFGEAEGAESCAGGCCGSGKADKPTHRPWYADRFDGIEAVMAHWREQYGSLRERSSLFRDAFFESTLPPEVVEAVAANLTILKSPTVLRQTDGRLWCWEGCCDGNGCCEGSCTHVWNYAQALPHLFPDLERTLRQTEFHECQDERGHQCFRAPLPIRPAGHTFHSAADGQLGGIMKVHREWRISGDDAWLRSYWPLVMRSLDYCIETWDPDRAGAVVEPHHNTYDIEFWGADGMCMSFYLGALTATVKMGEALGEDVSAYRDLADKARQRMEGELYNGEYFIQKVQWEGLCTPPPDETVDSWSVSYAMPESMELLRREGPKYQYGEGCLADGVLGDWMARMCGVGSVVDEAKVHSHLSAVFAHNFRESMQEHANPQRAGFALGDDAGLVLCTWPRGQARTLPFPYSNEVWTGIEYHLAAHLAMHGEVDKALTIVRAARDRYDGAVRNPFSEYECGHWYARAMSSYGLLQGLTGIRYDAVDKTLYVRPRVQGDFRSFLSTATGFGVVGVRDGAPFVETRSGTICVDHVEYTPYNV